LQISHFGQVPPSRLQEKERGPGVTPASA
jgi:hypothetical protein